MVLYKRLTAALLAAGLIFSNAGAMEGGEGSVLPDLSAYESRIQVDGVYLESGDKPISEGDGSLLPLRTILENSGFSVDWRAADQTVLIKGQNSAAYELNVKTGALQKEGEGSYQNSSVQIRGRRTYANTALFNEIDGLAVSWDRATKTAVVKSPFPKDNLFLYDLGQGTLAGAGGETKYQMQGIIGVPDGENRPVVVLLHGSHPVERAADNRYDLGLSYLVDALADEGYLAVSMNVGMNFSFEKGEPNGNERTLQIVQQQLNALSGAIRGEENAFPVDLTGKGDLSQTVLVGHSRSGADLFDLAAKTTGIKVAGLLALAPSEYSPLEGALADVPTAIVIPEDDGDVSQLDGAQIYEKLLAQQSRTAPAELVFLSHGNHNSFSTALLTEDPFASAAQIADRMPAQQQRAFTVGYTVDFVGAALAGQTPNAAQDKLPDTLHGAEVLLRASRGGETVFRAGQGMTAQTAGARAEEVTHSYIASENTAGMLRLPGTFRDFPLLRVSWEQKDAAVRFGLKSGGSTPKSLRIELAQDSTDEKNGGKDQRATLVLTDADGKTATVSLDGAAALRHRAGETEWLEDWDGSKTGYYSAFTPLCSVRVPLEGLAVDAARLTQAELRFPEKSGSVVLREMVLEA